MSQTITFVSVPDFKDRSGNWVRSSQWQGTRATTVSGDTFANMQARCSARPSARRWPSYRGCTVEFEGFQDFVDWHRQQVGYGLLGRHLDKDILLKGSKAYSRDTCCLVPEPVNKVLLKREARRGKYPVGVHWSEERQLFVSQISVDAKIKPLGRFMTVNDAFSAYKEAKEAQIREVARRYKDDLDPRVFDALMTYQVEITD